MSAFQRFHMDDMSVASTNLISHTNVHEKHKHGPTDLQHWISNTKLIFRCTGKMTDKNMQVDIIKIKTGTFKTVLKSYVIIVMIIQTYAP